MGGLYKNAGELISTTFSVPKTPKELWRLLEDILTPQEIMDIGERVHIIHALKQGKSQRDIADELGISITTVSRGSRVLKYGTGGAKDYIA